MTTENHQKGEVTVDRRDLRALLKDVDGYGLKRLASKIDPALFQVIDQLEMAVRYAS